MLHVLPWAVPIAATLGLALWVFRTPDAVVKLLRRVPLGDARALAAGQRVRLVGIARSTGEHVVAPDAGQHCLAFVATAAETLVRTRGFASTLVTTYAMTNGFAVETAGGTVEVGAAAKDRLKLSAIDLAVPQGEPPKPLLERALPRPAGQAGVGAITEQVVTDGARVAVAGTVEIVGGKPRLVATAAQPLLVSTLPSALRS